MAARRRIWSNLSENYRKRLERGGISKSAYESGTSLSAARGHRTTPERPERALRGRGAGNPAYNDYRNKLRRKGYILDKAVAYTKATIGDLPKYNHSRVIERAKRKTVAQLKETLKLDKDQLRFLYTRDTNPRNVWFYH